MPADEVIVCVLPVKTTPAVADRLISLPVIVKSVPSPSIFSPSSPKVRPMLAGILTSPFVPGVKFISPVLPPVNVISLEPFESIDIGTFVSSPAAIMLTPDPVALFVILK